MEIATRESLPPHLLYNVLEACPLDTIISLSRHNSTIGELARSNGLMTTKLLEVLEYSGHKTDDEFRRQLRESHYSYECWIRIFEYYSPYIRWYNTVLYQDVFISINRNISKVIMANQNFMRVEIPGGFQTYKYGEEIYTTPVQGLIARENIFYTQNHMMVKPHASSIWSLVEYSICDENNLVVSSDMNSLNDTLLESGAIVVDVVSNENFVIVLCTDRVYLYNWTEDEIILEEETENMVNIIPEFLDDGNIFRFILSDDENRFYCIFDLNNGISMVDVGKSCKLVLPLFNLNAFWTVDENGVQATISLLNPKNVSEGVLGVNRAKKATYVPHIDRIFVLSESGEVFVGEIRSGKFVLCGNMNGDPQQSLPVVDIVSGRSELALVGTNVIRYISFSEIEECYGMEVDD